MTNGTVIHYVQEFQPYSIGWRGKVRDYICDHIINTYFPNTTGSFMRKKKMSSMFSRVPSRSLTCFESMTSWINCSQGQRCGVDRFSVLERELWRKYGERIWRDMNLEAGLISCSGLSFGLQNPWWHLPGPYNIPKCVCVLDRYCFHSVGPHGGKVCIEVTGAFCFVSTLPHVTFGHKCMAIITNLETEKLKPYN